jgi:hypothetical protein
MQAGKILESLFGRGKISPVDASLKMGRKSNFISSYKHHGNIPGVDVMAEIADAIGYDLLMRSRETHEEILIEPPKRAD